MSELKEQALLSRIGELVVNYENHIADLRVEVTRLTDLNIKYEEDSHDKSTEDRDVVS